MFPFTSIVVVFKDIAQYNAHFPLPSYFSESKIGHQQYYKLHNFSDKEAKGRGRQLLNQKHGIK